MAGIYVHIPFCRKVCYYCDFFFTVSLKQKSNLADCLKRELSIQKNYLENQVVKTIYFGGGTPSVFTPKEISGILSVITDNFLLDNDIEVTLEANPDDLTESYLSELSKTNVNRLSVGVQSFHDEDLVWMNRRHTGQEALKSLQLSREFGFNNLSADLIYGFPLLTSEKWKSNIQTLIDLEIKHMSCYLLGIEPKTVFGVLKNKGKLKIASDEFCAEQFSELIQTTRAAGYLHYEISNFCKPGYFSRHNTSYWNSETYLGIGPSANSYNGHSRQWNVKSIGDYINSIEKGVVPAESETLDIISRYNDYILTSLRTIWGIDPGYITTNFGVTCKDHFIKESKRFVSSGELYTREGKYFLNESAMLVADHITSQLFMV